MNLPAHATMTANAQSILVVDDDPEIRKLLARYIESQGFRVLLAANCRELRDQLATHHIDLIVLDVMLPDGSGLDLCRDLRAQRSSVPIILLTALKEDVDRIIGLEIGADDYLGKPFNPRELIARVRAVLRRRAEFDLLKTFLDRPGRVLSRDQLLDITRGREGDVLDRSIDVLVSRLRRKLGEGGMSHLFKTVRNGGYQLTVKVDVQDEAP
jgi:two-component system OmpR family response regulator